MANLNFNQTTIAGKLTKDLELKKTKEGKSIISFSIAVNRKGKSAGVDFINCVAWENTAELISTYFNKGSSIMVVGELRVRNYEDKEGVKRSATEVLVNNYYFVDSKSEKTNSSTTKVSNPQFGEIPGKFEEFTDDDELPF